MAEGGNLAAPVMRRGARLQPDQTGRQLGEERTISARRNWRRKTIAPAVSTPCT